MAGFYSPFASQALAANGDNSGIGYVDVSDATQFEIGATVSLAGDTVPAAMYQVGAVDTVANRIGVRILYIGTPRLNGQNYGLTSVAQYTTADNARVVQNVQFIYAESGTAEADAGFSIGPFGGTSAAGLAFSSGELHLTAANGTNPGGVSAGAQSFGGAKNFLSTIAASNLSGTNTGDVTIGAFGSSPTANAISRSGQILTAQPCDSTHPGSVSLSAQTMGAGIKTFTSKIIALQIGGAFASNFGIEFPNADNTIYYRTGSAADGAHRFADLGTNIWLQLDVNGTHVGGPSVTGLLQTLFLQYTNQGGSPGNKTINRASGRMAIANGANVAVLTNSSLRAGAIVVPTLETPAAGVANIVAQPNIPGVGQCTFTSVNGTGVATNVTADAVFSFIVINTE